jgi:hypothetical protein
MKIVSTEQKKNRIATGAKIQIRRDQVATNCSQVASWRGSAAHCTILQTILKHISKPHAVNNNEILGLPSLIRLIPDL